MTYSQTTGHIISFGLIAVLATIGLFQSTPSSADVVINPVTNNETNSQRMDLLSADYGIEVPAAIGGPNNISIQNRLALLIPQVGITTGSQTIENISVDPLGIITYIVQKGDTLSEIAEKFDVSSNTIKWENDLGKTLSIGKELRILPVTGVRHTIKKGDTLSKIANTYDVEIEDITIFNTIDESSLVVGEKIIVPNGVKKSTVVKSVDRSTSSASVSIPSNSVSNTGYYLRPTTGPATSLFGPRSGRYHYGIDYGAPTGTPIVASAAGTVIATSCGSGYGKCLKIQHNNGTQTLYAHASQLYVNTGTSVAQGQKIAAIGSTGRSTGPHLHFEIIRSNGTKMNTNFLR